MLTCVASLVLQISGGKQQYENHVLRAGNTDPLSTLFCWHGFQYARVTPLGDTGFTGALDAIVGLAIHTNMSQTGSLTFGGEGDAAAEDAAEVLTHINQMTLQVRSLLLLALLLLPVLLLTFLAHLLRSVLCAFVEPAHQCSRLYADRLPECVLVPTDSRPFAASAILPIRIVVRAGSICHMVICLRQLYRTNVIIVFVFCGSSGEARLDG